MGSNHYVCAGLGGGLLGFDSLATRESTYSPSIEVNRVQFLAALLPDFRVWKLCRTMLPIGGFSCPYILELLHIHLTSPHWLSNLRLSASHRTAGKGRMQEPHAKISSDNKTLSHLMQGITASAGISQTATHTDCTYPDGMMKLSHLRLALGHLVFRGMFPMLFSKCTAVPSVYNVQHNLLEKKTGSSSWWLI
ncbi:hypothetical protein PR048_002615 [Dryococelus australis]|uniref:Uncharacterized protein n=1 Tax=Dryococelus australis TaxID=614101 RepID=A0ABQ9IKU0_9NEOP|nr:hypothetical protein PR048_002615 [Dryococelus australis]